MTHPPPTPKHLPFNFRPAIKRHWMKVQSNISCKIRIWILVESSAQMWGFCGINAETQYALSSILADLYRGIFSFSICTSEPLHLWQWQHNEQMDWDSDGLVSLCLFSSDPCVRTLVVCSLWLTSWVPFGAKTFFLQLKVNATATNEQDSCLTVLCGCTALHPPEFYQIARRGRAHF